MIQTLEQLKAHIADPTAEALPIHTEGEEALFEMWYECLLDTAVYHASTYWEPLGMLYRYVGNGNSTGNLMVEIVGSAGSFSKWIKQEYPGSTQDDRILIELEECGDQDLIERFNAAFRSFEPEEKPH
jgi:hypothetical protein